MMSQKWINKTINKKKAFKSYEDKYGIFSDYDKSQKIVYSDQEIKANIKKAFKLIGNDNKEKKILDIGVNNGYEIELIPKSYLKRSELIGIDLSRSAILKAQSKFTNSNFIFLLGDIREFKGYYIKNKKEVNIEDNAFDDCLAFNSLQSTGLESGFSSFFRKLIKKMKTKSNFLIIVPNCSIKNNKLISGGVFDDQKKIQNKDFGPRFVDKCVKILKENKYKTTFFGNKFIFLIAKR